MCWLFIILGIAFEIVKANNLFTIPNYISCMCFGIGGVLLFINIINSIVIKHKANIMLKNR